MPVIKMGKAVVVGYILERAVELLDAELLIKAVDPDAVALLFCFKKFMEQLC